jgi:hypothetical protein
VPAPAVFIAVFSLAREAVRFRMSVGRKPDEVRGSCAEFYSGATSLYDRFSEVVSLR